MTKIEFVKSCSKLGYSSKDEAEDWCEKHPKDIYTEDDYIEIYRHSNTPKIGEDAPYTKWRTIYGGHRSTKHYKNPGSDHS